jgi:predicted extracellular nuclease
VSSRSSLSLAPSKSIAEHADLRRLIIAVALLALGAAVLSRLNPAAATSPSLSNSVVISQVYGGGGNSGSTFKNDFIEIYNLSNSTLDLSGWSIQYAPATSGTWQVTALSGSISPGHYYLIQEAQGSGGTTNLPTPDAFGGSAMSATNGKVALVNSSGALSGTCPNGNGIVDLVGYGSTASCFEGSGRAPSPNNMNAVFRAGNGCNDTDNNKNDFVIGLANPRNSSSQFVCGSATPTPTATPTPSANCGVERWSVKTGTDLDVGAVNLSSISFTTVADM